MTSSPPVVIKDVIEANASIQWEKKKNMTGELMQINGGFTSCEADGRVVMVSSSILYVWSTDFITYVPVLVFTCKCVTFSNYSHHSEL